MAGLTETTAAASRPPALPADALGVKDLARGILAKEIRPRAADVRRLAEALLAGAKPKKAKGAKKKDKSRKKLAKIPGQRSNN